MFTIRYQVCFYYFNIILLCVSSEYHHSPVGPALLPKNSQLENATDLNTWFDWFD